SFFHGNYGMHSILYNRNGSLQDGRLGKHLSHGCVRLDTDVAKYIYQNIPVGTTVRIYKK
ncbi:MAG: L,D-transpeptidase, partial [Clostridiales bacterium]|nr:L,D-transpeptidase [Clostridiales bacterium]